VWTFAMMKRWVMALSTWINLFEPGTNHLRVLIVISLHFMQKPIHKHKLLKSQIPSTKLQINLKLQYPMTKTDELAKRQKPFFLSF
jgi:hypothetical protein